jgi:hypothetical protein
MAKFVVFSKRHEQLEVKIWIILGMHRILFLPDIRPAGYPANPKAGYMISGRIPG